VDVAFECEALFLQMVLVRVCTAIVATKTENTIGSRNNDSEDCREVQRVADALPKDDLELVPVCAGNLVILMTMPSLLSQG